MRGLIPTGKRRGSDSPLPYPTETCGRHPRNTNRPDLRGADVRPESCRRAGVTSCSALSALVYTWAVMESYELGGELVRPNALPPLHGDPLTMPD